MSDIRDINTFNEIARELAAGQVVRSQIPEDQFFHIYLPWFSGLANPYNVGVRNWLSVAGSHYNEVDVIGKDGTVLYAVPPLCCNEAFDPARARVGNATLSDLLNYATKLSQHFPGRGVSLAKGAVTDRLSEMHNPDLDLAGRINRWHEIFKRYKVPSPFEGITGSKQKSEAAAGQVSGGLVVDEWENL